MAYFSSENRAGVGYGFGIADVSSTQGPYRLGEIIRAIDSVNTGSGGRGGGEFIYLKGNATEVEGSLVTYNPALGTTTLIPTSNKNLGYPVAVSMAAKAAGQHGWYQISGVAKIAKDVNDFGVAAKIFASTATAGYATASATSGAQILGAITANSASVSSTTSHVMTTINRPHLQGVVTS